MSDKKTIIKNFQSMKPSIVFKQLDYSKLPKEVRDKMKGDLSGVSDDTLDLQFEQSTFKKWIETFADLYPAAFGIKEEAKVVSIAPVAKVEPVVKAEHIVVAEEKTIDTSELETKIKDLETRLSVVNKMILKQPLKKTELKIRVKTIEKMIAKFKEELKNKKASSKKKVVKKSLGGFLFGALGGFIAGQLVDLKLTRKKVRFDLGGTIHGDKKYKYSITYTTIFESENEENPYEDNNGFEVENEIEELQDILQEAVNKYGISSPTGSPIHAGISFESVTPKQDRDYFEKGIETYFTLHVKNVDGSDITLEETQLIADKLKEGRKLHWDEEEKNWWKDGGEIHSKDTDGTLVFKADTKGGKYSIEVREGASGNLMNYDIRDYTNGSLRGMSFISNKELLMHKLIDTILGSKKIDGINYIISHDDLGVKEYLPASEKIWDIYNSAEFREWFKKQNETLTEEQKQSLSDELKNKTIKYVRDNGYKENDSTIGSFFQLFRKERLIKDFYESKGMVMLKDGGDVQTQEWLSNMNQERINELKEQRAKIEKEMPEDYKETSGGSGRTKAEILADFDRHISERENKEFANGGDFEKALENLHSKASSSTTPRGKNKIIIPEGDSVYTMSQKDRDRLDELQIKENEDRLTKSENDEYEELVKKYRKTKSYSNKGGVDLNKDKFSLTTINDDLVQMVIGEDWTAKEFKEHFLNKGYELKPDNSIVGFYFAKPDGQTFQLVPSFHKKGEIIKYKDGGSISSDNTPKVYIADLAAYNEGSLVGEWLDLSEFGSGEEVMEKISELLKQWSEEAGEEREEYSVHDMENFPKQMYSEGMGESSFQKVIDYWEAINGTDYPMEVVEEFASLTGEDVTDAVDKMKDAYYGKFDDVEDFAREYVDSVGGIEGVSNPEQYIDISETDKRIIASEEADNVVDGMSDDDILKQANLYDEYQEAEDSENEEEMDRILEEAKESVREEIESEWEKGLRNPYNFLVEEQGLYDSSSIMKANFIMFDYKKFGKDLEQDYYAIEHDGEVYIFNQNYKKGGSLPSSRSLGVSIEKIEIDIPDFRPEKLKEQTKTNKKPKTMAKKSAGSNKNKERMTLIQSVAKKIWAEGKCEKYSEAVSLASKKLKKEGKL